MDSEIGNFLKELASQRRPYIVPGRVAELAQRCDSSLMAKLCILIAAQYAEPVDWSEALLWFLPESEFPGVIQPLVRLVRDSAANQTARNVLDEAARQFPSYVAAYLDELIGGSGPEGIPVPAISDLWLLAPESTLVKLHDYTVRNSQQGKLNSSLDQLAAARRPDLLNDALNRLGLGKKDHRTFNHGYIDRNDQVFMLTPQRGYCVMAGPDYGAGPDYAQWHPTRNLSAAGPPYRLGGELPVRCETCGGAFHRLLELSPAPEGLDVSLDRLDLCCCLSCLGPSEGPLFVHHDDHGDPVAQEPPGHAEPSSICCGFLEAGVCLADMPARWRNVEWHNPNRLGIPWWVQNADFPACPGCGSYMNFLGQLSSNLPPALPDGAATFSPDGCVYFYWCDPCRVSAYSIQYT
jgi:hypothetical protein